MNNGQSVVGGIDSIDGKKNWEIGEEKKKGIKKFRRGTGIIIRI